MIHVSVTCPDTDCALRIARAAMAARLAACANVTPGLTSVFHWEGAVAEEAEVALSFKTTATCRADLVALIRADHPYDLPVVSWEEVETTPDVHAWLASETSG